MAEISPGINVDPQIQGGTPVVAGTRVPVSLVLDQLASGMSTDEVATQYRLTREQVLSCIRFAKDELRQLEYQVA